PMIAIVTDSAANLPTDLAATLGVEVVPLVLRIGDTTARDGLDLGPTDLYRRLARDHEVASTAAPSPGDFLEAFGRAGQRDILCITVASTMSATFDAARLAADRFGGRVEVVDSLSASMAQGFVVKEAAAAVAGGAGLEDAAARARE